LHTPAVKSGALAYTIPQHLRAMVLPPAGMAGFREIFMNRRNLLALGFALALGGLGEARAQSRLDFALANRTGYEINEVYIGPTSASSWGSDVMGQDTLPHGRSVDIQFNRSAAACNWDMKVVYADGDESEWRNLNLCSISRVALHWDRKSGTTRAVTE
jgi:hypothetical protein